MGSAEVGVVAIRPGLTLSYAAQGDPSRTAVVFLPGPTDSWRSYAPVLERLPSSTRAIAVSQRGHGDSAKPPNGYAIADFAGDVVPLLDALGVDQAVLAGHSGSSPVVRRVALDDPGRVAGLVLEASPTTLRGNAGLHTFIDSVVSTLQDPIDRDLARSFLADTSSDDLAPELIDELVAELVKVPVRVWKETFAGLAEYDDGAELEHLEAPTLLLWGDADRIVTREMQDTLAARIQHAELHVYEGVGHTPRWEAPDRFSADVAAFAALCGFA
ncbi:MAG TPA: alpha/beta hydrolase [Acidimicrobiales bacterium]|nr:alpha/beta hydrolase [Acidimicrobiales bacterium]